MKLLVPAKSVLVIDNVISQEECRLILDTLKSVELARWSRRNSLHLTRAEDPNQTSDYYFGANNTFAKETTEFLMQFAPVVEGLGLDEVCVNWYLPGDGIGTHTDRRQPRNMVISLETNEKQGCVVNGQLYHDVAGRALVHPGVSLPHSVPNVTTERFVLIFLYDYQGRLQCQHKKLVSEGLNP